MRSKTPECEALSLINHKAWLKKRRAPFQRPCSLRRPTAQRFRAERSAVSHFVAGAAGAAGAAAAGSGVAGGVAADVSVGAAPPVVLVGSAAGLSPPQATEPITHAIETKRAIFFMSSSIEIKGIRREESHAVHTASGGRRQGARVWGQASTIFAAFKALVWTRGRFARSIFPQKLGPAA